jgi:hypothetical protein
MAELSWRKLLLARTWYPCEKAAENGGNGGSFRRSFFHRTPTTWAFAALALTPRPDNGRLEKVAGEPPTGCQLLLHPLEREAALPHTDRRDSL